MKIFRFDGLLQKQGWISPAYISVNKAGLIISISSNCENNVDETVHGWALPTVTNAHSHAFQYAMTALAENSNSSADDFWSWRNVMYSLANKINPDQLESVAKRLYAELLRVGYGWVTEFHYLHRDKKAKTYTNPAEMSERLIYAAREVGIGITLVPVFYKNSDFNKKALTEQKRFLFDGIDTYFNMLEKLHSHATEFEKVKIGCGVHSIRSADVDDIIHIMNQKTSPKHIHIAEQVKEVNDCIAAWGARPVQWLCEHVDVDENVNLVHATHINGTEVNQLISAKANVVLCPSTEANLGDGLFPLNSYVHDNGRWCVGSDSHVQLNPFEEIRWLDYCQRLVHQNRIPFCCAKAIDPVSYAFEQVISNGRLAAGVKTEDYFELNQAMDCLVFSSTSVLLDSTNVGLFLSKLIYSSDCSHLLGTIISGKWKIINQKHLDAKNIDNSFKKTIVELDLR